MALDKKVLDDRLAFRETTFSAVSVGKVVIRFNAFVSSLEKDPVKAKENYNAVMKDLMLMKLEISKAEAVFRQSPKEKEELEHYVEHIRLKTTKVEEEIAGLKGQLVVERQIRQQKEEYEALGKLANQFPAKAITRAENCKLNQELAGMEEEKKRLTEALDYRKRQLSFILNAVMDLKEGLEYDQRTEEEKERYLAEDGRGQGGIGGGGAGVADMVVEGGGDDENAVGGHDRMRTD